MEGFADSSKRARAGAKRFDLTGLRKAVEDNRVMPAIGVVWQPPGEASHYDLEPDQSGNGTDILVHVQKMPHEEPLLCYLACSSMWRIPPVGTVVALLVPDGDLEAGAIIVGMLPSGSPPAGLDGSTAILDVPKIVMRATAGDAELDATGNVVLGGGTTAAAIANTGTPAAMGLVDWMAAVTSFVNGLASGTLTGPSGYTSTKVKA